ncbi:hypothetical protein PAV_14c00420 [Paenibacillus alvei DSM 29]|nr:hypothetical protein PAV_14c00420 [Paenibacillus alvei DSM 29]
MMGGKLLQTSIIQVLQQQIIELIEWQERNPEAPLPVKHAIRSYRHEMEIAILQGGQRECKCRELLDREFRGGR